MRYLFKSLFRTSALIFSGRPSDSWPVRLRRETRTCMIVLITIVHIIVCFFLIIVVLLQSGKSGDIAAAFGGAGSQTAFGPRGAATALSKATTWSTIIFMLTSITLSIMASRRSGSNSVLQGIAPSQTKSQPATPTKPPAPAPQK